MLMKLKLILCLFGVFSLLNVNVYASVSNDAILETTPVLLTGNDILYDVLTNGDKGDHRSARPTIPIYVMLDDSNSSLDLYFELAVGEIEITISQDSDVVYSSSEYIECPVQKSIQLPLGISGKFLIEIKGNNGACTYGWFDL